MKTLPCRERNVCGRIRSLHSKAFSCSWAMKADIVGAGHQNKSDVGTTAVRSVVSSPQLRVRLAAVTSSSALL